MAYLFLVRPMSPVLVYRTLLVVRGCWWVGAWVVRWSHWTHSYTLLFTSFIFSALGLIVLIGLWFLHRWARWTVVALLLPGLVYAVARPHHSGVSATLLLGVMLNTMIVAGPFMPPLRDMFSKQDLTNR